MWVALFFKILDYDLLALNSISGISRLLLMAVNFLTNYLFFLLFCIFLTGRMMMVLDYIGSKDSFHFLVLKTFFITNKHQLDICYSFVMLVPHSY